MSKLCFLIYDSRSGSTLLSRLFDEYEDIGVTIESNFMINLLHLKREFKASKEAASIFRKLLKMDRSSQIVIDPEMFLECFEKAEKSINSFVKCLIETYFASEKPRAKAWIVKDGANGYYIHQIASEIPDVKFIHLLRDGRAVLNSQMKTVRPYGKGETMSRDPLSSARYWKSFVNNVDAFGYKFPERLLEIRYEKLITQTEEELLKIRRFLELSEKTYKKSNSKSYFEKIPEREKRIHVLTTNSPQQSRCDAWKDELPINHRKLFEYIASDTLSRKGYEEVQIILLTDILQDASLFKLYFQSYMKRAKSWMFYTLHLKRIKTIIHRKLLRIKENNRFTIF